MTAGWPIIALVTSAGGVDALKRVVTALPGDLGAGILVLMHSDPERQSMLAGILRRNATLGVDVARDGAAVEPARVLVAPSGRHVLITPDLRIALIESGAYPPSRPSADLLLTTLATAARERAIAVVLTGGGHDGATGASAIRHFGGTVVATDEASSMAYSMPAATIARGSAIDHIVHLDQLATLLTELVTRMSSGSAHG